MTIELYRSTCNHLYTRGKMVVNGSPFADTVEHTLSMLPIGEYRIELKKLSSSRSKMVIQPNRPKSLAAKEHYLIDKGNSWKDAQARHSIIIGEPMIPGCVVKSPALFEKLFNRMEKSVTPITLAIYAFNCIDERPSQFWLSPRDHGCPPSPQYVEADEKGNITIYHGDGTFRYLSIEQQNANISMARKAARHAACKVQVFGQEPCPSVVP